MSSKTQNIHSISFNKKIAKSEDSSKTTTLLGGTLGKVIIFATAFLFMLVASQISNI